MVATRSERFVVPTLRGITWCLGMSELEPAAISQLSTRAERSGDCGEWPEGLIRALATPTIASASYALIRRRLHRGISILIIDMRTPASRRACCRRSPTAIRRLRGLLRSRQCRWKHGR
jgi:hypothetical protein